MINLDLSNVTVKTSSYGGGDLYLECGTCEDFITSLEPDVTLESLVKAVADHEALYHPVDDDQ